MRFNETPLSTKLSSLAEDDESQDTPKDASAPQSSIAGPSGWKGSKDAPQTESPAFKTPTTVSRLRPGLDEMHPSKVHRSTTKPAGSVSRSTIESVETVTTVSQPGLMASAVAQSTPTKLPGAWPQISSPKFEFTIGQDESVLSVEAQRIMESVRAEAAKIKAQMHVERDKQELEGRETMQNLGVLGRKIAKPKGRFSDAHREQFQKMDSIAGHASIWKNRIQPNIASLTNKSDSDFVTDVAESRLPGSKSFNSLKASRAEEGDRLENLAPGKRVKKSHGDDTSSARPISRDETVGHETIPSTASKASLQPRLLSAFTTPTKASLARTASVKSLKPSLIPSPSRGTLMLAKSEGSKKYRQSLAKFGHIKSFLHRRQPGIANDPSKESVVPPLAMSEDKLRLGKALPSLPQPTITRLLSSPSNADNVQLTPAAKSKTDCMPVSPSPSKIPEARSLHKPSALVPDLITYPSIANSPNITTRVKVPTASIPGDFTFRSERNIVFNPAPTTPTIRRVRPSGVSTPLANFNTLPPIPHGLPNKKRRRADSDDEDIENVAPASPHRDDKSDEPRTKKLKSLPQKASFPHSTADRKGTAGSKIPQARGGREKSRGRSVLSLSRLNMLARPKSRR